ncbi:MAG: translocation/assembly module TamB domain-containing protein [Spirochaetota bacterium]
MKLKTIHIHLLQAFIFLALVAGTFLLVWPLQKEVDRRIGLLKKEVVQYLESTLNRKIAYKSIAPSIFRYIEIRNLVIYNNDHNAPLLEIKKIRAYFNIFKLLAGNPAASFYELSLSTSHFAIDQEKDGDLLKLFSTLISPGGGTFSGLNDIIVSGRNLSLSYRSPNGMFEVERIFFSLYSKNESLKVRLKGRARISPDTKIDGISLVKADFNVSGSIDENLKWSDLKLKLNNFTSNMFEIKALTFQVNIQNQIFQIRKIQDKAPLDIEVTYNLHGEKLIFNFVSENFIPSSYITLGKTLKTFKPWSNTVISGSGTLEYFLKTNKIYYSSQAALIIDNKIVPTRLMVKGDFQGGLDKVYFHALNINSKLGVIDFRGDVDFKNFYPSGTLELTDFYYITGEKLNTRLTVERMGTNLRFLSALISIGKTNITDASIMLVPYKNNIDFFCAAGIEDSIENNYITAEGNIQLKPQPFLQVSLKTGNVPLVKIVRLFINENSIPGDLAVIMDRFRVSSDIFLSTDMEKISFVSPKMIFTDNDNPNNYVSFGIAGNQQSVEVTSLELSWWDYLVEGTLTSDFSEPGRIEFASNLSIKGIPYKLQGFYHPGDSLTITGDYGLDAILIQSTDGMVFRIVSDVLPLPLPTGTISASLNINGVFRDNNHWEILAKNTTFTNLPYIPDKDNTVSLSAHLSSPGEGTIYNIIYKDNLSKLNGNGEIKVGLSRSFYSSGWIQMLNREKGEAYEAVFEINENKVNSRISFNKAPLNRFAQIPITGAISGYADVRGPIIDPDVDAVIRLEDGQFNADPISFETSASLTETRFELTSLKITYLSNKLSNCAGYFDFSTGTFSFTTKFAGKLQNDPLNTDVSISGSTDLKGKRNIIPELSQHDFAGSVSIKNIQIGTKNYPNWIFVFKKVNRLINFRGGPNSEIVGTFNTNGNFHIDLLKPFPLTFSAEGKLEGGQLQAELKEVELDLKSIESVVTIPFYSMKEGTARGAVTLSGPLNDPDFNGDFSATGVIARTPFISENIGYINTGISFRNKTVSIQPAETQAGKGEIAAQADITLDHWLPNSIDIKINTIHSKKLFIKNQFPSIFFEGYTAGWLRIKIDANGAYITGEIEASAGTITMRTAEPSGETGGDTLNLFVDVEVVSGRQLQFLWPSAQVPILQTFAGTGEKVHIKINGSEGKFSINGNINIKGGEIYYFSRSFYLKEGMISFNENQDKFDPNLTAKAEIREISPQGEDVIIYLVADNNPFSHFSPRFTSEPSLSDVQILAMLGENIITELGGSQINLSSALVMTGDVVLGQFGILKTFEQKVKDLFKLDLFSLRTQVFSSLMKEKILGVALSQSETSTSTLGKYLDNTTLFLGKYFGNDLFLEGLIRLRSKNMYISEYETFEDLKIDSELNLEWKTPLALVDITLIPDLKDFFSSVKNTSLSLSWRFSF